MTIYTATYSPDDNKLRLYASSRLDSETYARVRAAGFIFAPKQDLFVAPMWTPARADLLVELCGEIDDEDKSLEERAEERAERFEDYGDKRADDAEHAKAAVDRLANGIPLGQPILVGHHSEKRARKDAERIRNGMARAVRLWETSEYWERRAKGAIRHAKYKELPGVRARRIKGLEADQRRYERQQKTSETFGKAWSVEGLTHERALSLANFDRGCPFGTWPALERKEITVGEAAEKALVSHFRLVVDAGRWLEHIAHRLTYERAMLAASGYTPPAKRPRPKLAPMVNFPGDVSMTSAEWSKIHPDFKSCSTRMISGVRVRTLIRDSKLQTVYLTDAKRVDPPKKAEAS